VPVGRNGFVFDEVRHQIGPAPAQAVAETQPLELAIAEVEIGLGEEVVVRDALDEGKTFLAPLYLTDDDAFEVVVAIEKRRAHQLAETMELFLATADHARKGEAHLLELAPGKAQQVLVRRSGEDVQPLAVEIGDELIEERLLSHHPER
jgi:hypothetical protein